MKIVTLNVANYDDHKEWDQRLPMIVQTLMDLKPDLVAFQEIRFNPDEPSSHASYQNMAEQVLARIRDENGGSTWENSWIMTHPAMYYQLASIYKPWRYPQTATDDLHRTQVWEGLSILSRSLALETGGILLSNPPTSTDSNQRNTQYLTTDRQLYLFNTHFTLDKNLRSLNARETVDYMQRFGGQQMLAGDLNAFPDDPALNILREAGLTDLWPRFHPGDPGYTTPSDRPYKRFDYCWVNEALLSRVTGIELILTHRNANGVYASDHFGLCVTLDA